MDREDQDRVVVILVRARNPANIGAAARAMHDLGFRHLRIVNEFPVPFAAAKSAVDASSVLEAAMECATLAEAVADCTLVFGTTAVGERALEHPLQALPDAADTICATLGRDRGARIGLMFGSEKTGLSNDELSHCNALLTIPMNTRSAERHLSMNLGQAVAVCLYALAFAPGRREDSSPTGGEERGAAEDGAGGEAGAAAAGDVERLTALLREVLAASGYTRRHPANSREPSLRRLVRRMGLTGADAPVWTGILRQILHGLQRSAPNSFSSEAEAKSEIEASS